MDFLEITKKFGISEIFSVDELKAGHINKTYLINNKYVLQSVNGDIFQKPEIIMNNIEIIEQAYSAYNSKTLYTKIPHYLKYNNKNYVEQDGKIWRMCNYIAKSEQSQAPPFYGIGFAVGNFLRVVNSYNKEFANAIQLHNFKLDLPLRNIHGDAKCDNIILNVIPTIIDFDTAMRGYICIDYGDIIRSVTSDGFSHENIYLATSGFSDALRGFITPVEIDSLYNGIILVTNELYQRYKNPQNFPNKTPEQCRERAEQLTLQLENIYKLETEIKKIINECFNMVE